MPWSDDQIEEAAQEFENFDPSTARQVDVSALRAIAETADRGSRNEALLTEQVAVARAHGWSWNRIAVSLGVTRQAARQRFAGKIDA